jgi:hypothetical protein
MSRADWVRGDALGLEIPVHAAALRRGGAAFLTRTFRAAGALGPDHAVARITQFAEISGGSTGRKLSLAVEYEKPAPGLPTELFAKFSRDFDDPRRDAARTQMEREVRFALLSRQPQFPIAVPACCFADYHAASGSGLLITARVPFGTDGIEPQHAKAMDYRMPDAPAHYRALLRTLARLAGTERSGRLSDSVARDFPFDPQALAVARRAPHTPAQIAERVAQYAGFASTHPRLVPGHLRSPAFLARLADEAPRLQALASAAEHMLQHAPHLVALCHWNAHVDNAWFWRDGAGELRCGLLDWGNVSRMNLAMPLWGCLSGAEPELWDAHLDELLALFAAEFARSGGTALDLAELELHLAIYAGLMGLAWLLDCPAWIQARVPALREVESRRDPRIEQDERVRTQLLLLLNFLNLWQRQDMAQLISRLERHAAVQ